MVVLCKHMDSHGDVVLCKHGFMVMLVMYVLQTTWLDQSVTTGIIFDGTLFGLPSSCTFMPWL